MDFLNRVDLHVGARICATRTFREFELWELASAIQISTSLLIAYEAGRTRCLPQHLTVIAAMLKVPATFFFDGLRKKAMGRNFQLPNPTLERAIAINDNAARIDERVGFPII
jgi:hypothetical protein